MKHLTSSFILVVLCDLVHSVDVLGGRTTSKKEGMGASTVVSILIPTLLGVAVLIFCVICYYRKQREKKQTAHVVRAADRIKENDEPFQLNYQNSASYVYNRSQTRLPSYEGYNSPAFVPDFQVEMEPPPYSPAYKSPRSLPALPTPPPVYAPEFEPMPPRLASRYSANSLNQFHDGDDLSIRSQYEDEYSARNSPFPRRHQVHRRDFDNISMQSADYQNRIRANDMRLSTRSREGLPQRGRRGTPIMPRRTLSEHSRGSSRNFDSQSIISDTTSLNSGLSRSRSFLQMRPMTHESHTPLQRTSSARSHGSLGSDFSRGSGFSRESHRRHSHHHHHHRRHPHRFHHHRNSLKLPSSALRRSKSFHDNSQRKSVRFVGRGYESDGYECVSLLDNDNRIPKFYRTSSMPDISHHY